MICQAIPAENSELMSFAVFQARWLYFVEHKIILYLFIAKKKKSFVRNVTGDLIQSL